MWKVAISSVRFVARLDVQRSNLFLGSLNCLPTKLKCIDSSVGYTQKRHSSFMTEVPAKDLWEGVVGVSNAGKKKGRGKRVGRKKVSDLNRGQYIGSGRENMLWPGLNSPVLKGRAIIGRQQLPVDPERAQEIVRIRDQMSKVRYPSIPPLLRGYSGSKFNGQSVGSPDPVADYSFEDFDTRVLEFKTVCNMTGTLGRKMRFSAFVVTGNRNGVAGYGLGKALNAKAAIRVAKNKAAQKLMHVPRFEDHTVFHNMFVQYHRSKIFIHKKERGYGLRCHRVLKTICELLGMKDLHCKVENSTKNVQSVTKAFFNAVTNQETHVELAERMGYHVVEMRKEEEMYPRLVASPSSPPKKEQIRDEVEDLEVDFERLYYGGKCELPKRPINWFYLNLPSYLKKKKIVHSMRNQPQAAILRRAGLT